METLLSEAIHLIKSLETDRAEAEEALQRQKSRKKKDYHTNWFLVNLETSRNPISCAER